MISTGDRERGGLLGLTGQSGPNSNFQASERPCLLQNRDRDRDRENTTGLERQLSGYINELAAKFAGLNWIPEPHMLEGKS